MCSRLRYSNPEIRTKALKIFLITLALVTAIWELKALYSSESRKQITYKQNTQDTCLIPCCHPGTPARALEETNQETEICKVTSLTLEST